MIICGIEIRKWVNEPTNLLVLDPDGTAIWCESLSKAGEITCAIFNDRGVEATIIDVSYE